MVDPRISGISELEAARILKVEGLNEIPSQRSSNWFSILLRVLSEPMFLLLIISGLLYVFMGDQKDAMMLLSFVFVIIGITFYQERKTEKTLEALRNLSSPHALVIRDGKQVRIPGKEVVNGDIICLHEGDKVPADGVLLISENLSIDESLLTGESVPVTKREWDTTSKRQNPGGDNQPFVYSGSLVVSGKGYAKVLATGIHTEMGKIGSSLESIKEEDTLLYKETKKIVRTVAVIGLFLCICIVLGFLYFKGNLLEGLLSGLSLSMAMIPEEFPVILVIFLTLGAWRISKKRVLTRRSAAIETLGAATVLCTDKTGTVTQNRMGLMEIYSENTFFNYSSKTTAIPKKFLSVLTYGTLASQRDPFDPIEKELHKISNVFLKDGMHNYDGWKVVKEYPLTKQMFAVSHVWQSPDTATHIVATKGAPEAILQLCGMEGKKGDRVLKAVADMSNRGLRVLAVATASISSGQLSKDQHGYNHAFIGLLGFMDPIRESVPDSVKEAHKAGIRIIMVTGDYPGTAITIAKAIGLRNPTRYITGEELEKMDKAQLREKIKDVNIFARIIPEQKLYIVEALKSNGEIVVMTGDGVNDAPALKAAHIGIAMGERGTDVARETAQLVLLDDNFSSIVSAVRLGRRIYNNLNRAMGYVFSVHVPIAGMSLLPIFFHLPPVLFPAHIAFLELIIDPTCSIVFESEKEAHDIMEKPPRNLHTPMFTKNEIFLHIAQGAGILLVTFLLFTYMISAGKSELEARSFAFVSLVISNLILILVNLSWQKNMFRTLLSGNKTLYGVLAGTLCCLFAVLYIPFFANLFHLKPLTLFDVSFTAIVVFLSLLWFEILKSIQKLDIS